MLDLAEIQRLFPALDMCVGCAPAKSAHFYNTEEDVDRALDVLVEV